MVSLDNIKIFVVSLKDATERRNFITNQLNSLGLKFEFFDAINPKEFPEYLSYYNDTLSKEINGRSLTYGEIGCSLSHRFIYEKILSDDDCYCLILEDDALVNSDILFFLRNISELIKPWDVIILGYSKVDEKEFKRLRLFNPLGRVVFKFNNYKIGKVMKNSTCGTVAYLINHEGVKKLLKCNGIPLADNWNYFESKLNLNIFHCHPFLIFENFENFESSIESDRANLSKKSIHNIFRDSLKYIRGFFRYLILNLFSGKK